MSVELPKDWKSVKLGDVCNIQTGKYDANHAKPKGKYRFYTCAFEFMYCDTNRFKGESLILPGNGANVGEVFYYNGEFDAYQRTYVLNEIKSFPKYLYYHLLGNWKRKNQDKQFGSATNYIRMGNFTDYELPLPPKPTQLAIVCKIEELFSEIENGIQSLFTAKEQLKKYRQSVLKWAFEGKLTNGLNCELYDLLDEDDLSIAAEPETEYRVERNCKNQKNRSSDKGELPEGWEMKTIGDIFEVFVGSTPKRNRPEYWGGNINWVSSGEIAFCNITKTKEKVTVEGLENTSCKLHPIGTVIIAMIGEGKTRGQAAILKIEASHNQNTAAIRVDNKIYKSQLLYYYLVLKYEDNRRVGSGNNQKALNKERVKNISIPLPPIKEQQQIVQAIESRLSVADKMEESITQSLQQAEALKQSILKKAFEGKLMINEI